MQFVGARPALEFFARREASENSQSRCILDHGDCRAVNDDNNRSGLASTDPR